MRDTITALVVSSILAAGTLTQVKLTNQPQNIIVGPAGLDAYLPAGMTIKTNDLLKIEDPNNYLIIGNIITNTITENRSVTFTNLMLQFITTNKGGIFTNLIPVMTVGTNVGDIIKPSPLYQYQNLNLPQIINGTSPTGITP